MTKNELMALVSSGVMAEAFTHSIFGTFNITAMRAAAQDGCAERVTVALYDIVPFIREQRVTEASRIAALTPADIEDPGMGFDSPDGFVMVDGHHRALRRDADGRTHMDLWRFPHELMKAFHPAPGWVDLSKIDKRFDWGDPIVNGKIVRGGQ